MTTTLFNGDCLDVMPTLVENSVDLVLTDPPYNGVKSDAWDNQWSSDADYLEWLDKVLAEYERVLKFNGSLYLFASPQMSARVEVLVGGRFNVLNHIVWSKNSGRWAQSEKEILRGFFPSSERIIFAEHYNSDNVAKGEAGYAVKCDELRGFVFETLRAYLDRERLRAGISQREVIAYLGMTGHDPHFFKSVQWKLPLQNQYDDMRKLFNEAGGEYLRREYEDLRREYEDLRREYEDLRRPFAVTNDVPYTDVWTFDTVNGYKGKHPCEKPYALIEHIIKASSRPGAVILDTFAGSGVVGEAAERLGRDSILIEKDTHWYNVALERTNRAQYNHAARKVDSNTVASLPLFQS